MTAQVMKNGTDEHPTRLSFRRRCLRVLKGIVRVLLFALAFYIAIVLIGLLPVNNGFVPTQDGIEIFLVSNPVHADIVLPIDTDTIDWRKHFPAECFSGDVAGATHVAIGWGDRAFFIETPTWGDVRVSTAARALFWPSATCFHVRMIRAEDLGDDARSVKISVEQYKRLVDYINSGFRLGANGGKIQLDNVSYAWNDAFFEAYGRYHCLNTCNCWAGGAMKAGGIKTGWLTPLPKTILLYLPHCSLARWPSVLDPWHRERGPAS